VIGWRKLLSSVLGGFAVRPWTSWGGKMRSVHTRRLIGFSCLVFWGSCLLLLACGNDKCCPPTGGAPPEAVRISGRVLSLPLMAPVAGALVELEDGSLATTSAADGTWALDGVPPTPDPLIKVTAPGSPFPYPVAYNTFPLSAGLFQYDLQVMDPILYVLLAAEDLLAGADPNKLCLLFGAAVGFVSMDYPQILQPIEGVTIGVQPESLKVHYLNEAGMADPTLTATSSTGAFYIVVPDATAIPMVGLWGTKPDEPLVSGPIQTRPGSFIPAGLIAPFYVP